MNFRGNNFLNYEMSFRSCANSRLSYVMNRLNSHRRGNRRHGSYRLNENHRRHGCHRRHGSVQIRVPQPMR